MNANVVCLNEKAFLEKVLLEVEVNEKYGEEGIYVTGSHSRFC